MWKYILISCPFTYSLSLHFIFTCFINKQILYHFFFILYQFHFICFTSKMNIHQKISQIHSKPLPINSTNDSEQYWFLDNFVKIAMYIITSLLFLLFFYYWLMGIQAIIWYSLFDNSNHDFHFLSYWNTMRWIGILLIILKELQSWRINTFL